MPSSQQKQQNQTPSQTAPKTKGKTKPQQNNLSSILQRATQNPQTVSHGEMLQLQSAIGNRALQRMIGSGDGVAHQTGKGMSTPFSATSYSSSSPIVQRDITGTLANVKRLGGDSSLKSAFRGGAYHKILKQLGAYEKVEGTKKAKPQKDLNSIFSLAKGWMDNQKHMTSMESEESNGRGRAMGYVMGKIGRERGMFGDDKNANVRDVIHLYMGQGIVANLGRYWLSSDEFSTCSPVTMYNRNTGIGGLYHFPATSLKSLSKKNASHAAYMMAMAEAIQVTDIYVHSGGHRIHSELMEQRAKENPNDPMVLMEKMEMSIGGYNWREEQDDLISLFETAFTNATVHRGQGHGQATITKDDDGSIYHSFSGGGNPDYDLAQDAPPSDVLRFGHSDAGQKWVNGSN